MSEEKTVRWAEDYDQAGFTQVPNAVLLDTRLSHQARTVFALLAFYAREKDECFPGQERLAAIMNVTDRSVRTWVKELQKHGLLEVKRVGLGKTNLYTLHRPDRKQASALTGNVLPVLKKKEDAVEEDKVFTAEERREQNAIGAVFSHWQSTMGRERSKLTPSRRKKILTRFRSGISVETMKRAIDGCAGSEFHVQNGHNDLTLICRSEEKVEFFAALPRESADEDFFAGTEFAGGEK